MPLRIYKGISRFGEHWVRPLLVLLLWAAIYSHAILFGGVVLGTSGTGYRLVDYGLTGTPVLGRFLTDLAWAVPHTLSVALLRPSPDVAYVADWLRFMHLLSIVIGPTCVTFTLLALRRAFRRAPGS